MRVVFHSGIFVWFHRSDGRACRFRRQCGQLWIRGELSTYPQIFEGGWRREPWVCHGVPMREDAEGP